MWGKSLFHFNCVAPFWKLVDLFLPVLLEKKNKKKNPVCNKDQPTHPHAHTHERAHTHTHTHTHTHSRFLTPPTENRSAAHRHNSKQMHGLAHVARAQLLFVRVVTHTLTCAHTHTHTHNQRRLVGTAHLSGGFFFKFKSKERTKQHVGKSLFFFFYIIASF